MLISELSKKYMKYVDLVNYLIKTLIKFQGFQAIRVPLISLKKIWNEQSIFERLENLIIVWHLTYTFGDNKILLYSWLCNICYTQKKFQYEFNQLNIF